MADIFNVSPLKTVPHNLSLQGLTGIVFAFFNVLIIVLINFLINQFYSGVGPIALMPISFFQILLFAVGIVYFLIDYFLVTIFNKFRRKKHGLAEWDSNAVFIRKVYLIQFLVFALCAIVFLNFGLLKFIIPTSMLLYGVCCILVGNFTVGYSKVLGYFFILQSVLAVAVPDAQFFLWGMAFGGFHLVYALIHKTKTLSK